MTIGPPRLVIVIEFFLTTTFLGLFRFSPRLAYAWFLDRRRSRAGATQRTIIVGAGSAGELLLRDLYRSGRALLRDRGLRRRRSAQARDVDRRPPRARDAQPAARSDSSERHVSRLLFAIPRLPAARLREVLDACADLKLSYKVLPLSFTYLQDRAATAALQDLSPEDLLPRVPLGVVSEELLALIRGRRVLVTGAAGSIGSEICRQVARYAPASLVLTDINENELYFLYRFLRQQHPELVAERRGRRHPRRGPAAAAGRALPAAGRLPRRGPQARAADGVRARGGRQEQRDRVRERHADGRRPAASSASC